MGRHDGRTPNRPDDRNEDTNPIRRVEPTLRDLVQPSSSTTNFQPIEPFDQLVHPYPGVDPEPSQPTNPDLWGSDPHFDDRFIDEEDRNRSRRVALGAVLLSMVITVAVATLAWSFGVGSAETAPRIVYRTTEREVTVPVTETVTKMKKVTTSRNEKPVPTVTVMRTLPARPAPVVTKTIRQTTRATTTVRATVTATETEVVEVPVEVTVTETVTENQ